VSNWLTLPILAFAFLARVTGYGKADWRFVWLLSIFVLLGWAANLVGGADAKVSLAIILLDPRLAMWAWAGGVIYYILLLTSTRGRMEPKYLPGMFGFIVGIFAYVCIGIVW
jgi:hypothetical protein